MFRFRLCLALGIAHPDQLNRVLSQKQIAEWASYAQLEPFDQTRSDLRAAMVALTIARVGGNRNAKLKDFLLDFGPPPQPLSVSQTRSQLTALTLALGGKIEKQNGDINRNSQCDAHR